MGRERGMHMCVNGVGSRWGVVKMIGGGVGGFVEGWLCIDGPIAHTPLPLAATLIQHFSRWAPGLEHQCPARHLKGSGIAERDDVAGDGERRTLHRLTAPPVASYITIHKFASPPHE
jgi:hypothetical protein